MQELSSTWREQFILYGNHLELNANLSVPTAPLTLKCMANLFRAFRRVCAINLNSLLKHGQLLRSQWIHVKFASPPLIAFTKLKKKKPKKNSPSSHEEYRQRNSVLQQPSHQNTIIVVFWAILIEQCFFVKANVSSTH